MSWSLAGKSGGKVCVASGIDQVNEAVVQDADWVEF